MSARAPDVWSSVLSPWRKDRKCGEKAAEERGESTGRAYKFGWVGINFQIVLSEKRHIESFN